MAVKKGALSETTETNGSQTWGEFFAKHFGFVKRINFKALFVPFSTTLFSMFLVLLLMFVSFVAGSLSVRLAQAGGQESLFGLLFGTSGYQAGTGGNGQNPTAAAPVEQTKPAVNPNLEKISESDHIRGNRNAKVALIEYSDLECPFCQRFHPTAEQILKDYGNDVMWIYRHFPLQQLHPNAQKQAEASECAAKLGGDDAFWTFVDKVYAKQPGLGSDTTVLAGLAGEIGLDQSKFTKCLDSGETKKIVDADYQSGVKINVRGTPANIILNTQNNESILISGAQPISNFKVVIDPMLGK